MAVPRNRLTLSRCLSRRLVVAGVAAGLAWAGTASAGPAVISAARVEAFSAPSRDASVVSEFGQGAPVCVLDRTNYPGVLLDRAGWLAIRLPGGVGYVPVETVDLAAPPPEIANCGALTAAPGAPGPAEDPVQGPAEDPAQAPAQGPAQVLRPGAAPIAAFPRQSGAAPIAAFPRPGAASTSEPAPAVDRVPLLPGGFLPLRPARLMLGFGIGVQWLDSPTATANQIGDAGLTLNCTLGLTVYDVFMVSMAGGYTAGLSDKAQFSEDVVNQAGDSDPHSASSSIRMGSYSIAAGLRTPFWALGATGNGYVASSLFGQIGTAGVTSERSIANCSDCRTDQLNLSGGTFWRIGIDLVVLGRKPNGGNGLTVSYDQYLAGAGLANELRVGYSGWL